MRRCISCGRVVETVELVAPPEAEEKEPSQVEATDTPVLTEEKQQEPKKKKAGLSKMDKPAVGALEKALASAK